MGRNSQKKHAALNAHLGKSKLKKDPGVPRLPDLKVKHALKHQPTRSSTSDGDVHMVPEPTLQTLALAEDHDEDLSIDHQSPAAHAKRQYLRTLYRVIDQADVVLLVLDARDPEGCRSRVIEDEVRRREPDGKRLMFVLNKIDLVPRANAELWLRYLRHVAPTIPFRASTQEQRSNITSRTSSLLMNAIKSSKASAKSLTVGVVGYPNVGKSSIINSLKRSKVCAVGAEPGWTKEMQAVQVERGIKILDSPGVVFESQASADQNVLLRNVLKVDAMDDPIAVAELIFQRTTGTRIHSIYGLQVPLDPDFQKFLVQLALTTGKLSKAGVPDVEAAARTVIRDWNSHKIPFSSEPPKVHSSSVPGQMDGEQDIGDSAVVNNFAKPFELEGLWEADAMDEDRDEMVSDDLTPVIPVKRPLTPPPVDSLPFGDEDTSLDPEPSRKRSRSMADRDMDDSMMDVVNPISRKTQRKHLKVVRKKQRRSDQAVMDFLAS